MLHDSVRYKQNIHPRREAEGGTVCSSRGQTYGRLKAALPFTSMYPMERATLDRFVLGLTTLFVNPHRIANLGALVKPATARRNDACPMKTIRLRDSSLIERTNHSA